MNRAALAAVLVIMTLAGLLLARQYGTNVPAQDTAPPPPVSHEGDAARQPENVPVPETPRQVPADVPPAELPTGWLRAVKKGSGVPTAIVEARGEVYFVPEAKFRTMPRIETTVVAVQPCRAFFETAGGGYLCVGGPGAGRATFDFIRILTAGQRCTLPDAAADHQKRQETGLREMETDDSF